ncbi:MAG: DUF1343 domain-containing protein [Verrucomicrobiae bacterium]|nr:DUF1343 domain-containing protein [Verrucomicrobiae bacterium]
MKQKKLTTDNRQLTTVAAKQGLRFHEVRALFFIFCFLLMSHAASAVDLGIDVLAEHHFDLLRGKRVGLVTNQTGVNQHGVLTRLVLKKNVHLVALYTPEHGLDGVEKAGVDVRSRRDRLTGLTAFSLYGDTRKPTPQMLAGIDVLVFDMQDIGCRSYTYISTMAKCLQACAEQHKEFVILDRPNPLGGERIEGMPLDPQWVSFVGQLPVPYVHGMTMGELALMANEKGWMSPIKADLKVIRMRGWSRSMAWSNIGLAWVKPSPNIPNALSPFYYVVTGVVSELGDGIDIGIGTTSAFEFFTAHWIKPAMYPYLLSKCNGMGVYPYMTRCGKGVRFKINPRSGNLAAASLYLLAASYHQTHGTLIARAPHEKLNLFYKVYGSSSIKEQLARKSPEQIIASWTPFLNHFRCERQPFLLYQ